MVEVVPESLAEAGEEGFHVAIALSIEVEFGEVGEVEDIGGRLGFVLLRANGGTACGIRSRSIRDRGRVDMVWIFAGFGALLLGMVW